MAGLREVMLDYIKAWESRDSDAIHSFYADDAIYRAMPENEEFRGVEAIRAHNRKWLGNIIKAKWNIVHMGEISPNVIATERNDDLTLPNGRVIKAELMAIFEFDADYKIVGHRDYFDRGTVARVFQENSAP